MVHPSTGLQRCLYVSHPALATFGSGRRLSFACICKCVTSLNSIVSSAYDATSCWQGTEQNFALECSMGPCRVVFMTQRRNVTPFLK